MNTRNMSVLLGVTPRSNQSAPDNSTTSPSGPAALHGLPFMVVYSLVFLVGLLLNGVTLRVYLCGAGASSGVTVYLRNLAAADFMLSLFLPLRVANYATCSAAVRKAYCNFGVTAIYLNMYASILFMGYIAANRYFKIVQPSGSHLLQSVWAARVTSTVTWLVLLAFAGTYVILSLTTQQAPPPCGGTTCCDELHSEPLRLFYKGAHAFSAAIFLLVLLALLFFYYSTTRRLAAAQQRRASSCGHKKLAKSRRNIVVLVVIFSICFLPYHLVRLPYAFIPRSCSNAAILYLKEVTVAVSALNVCLDPLIYFLLCKAFRDQLRQRQNHSEADTFRYTATYPSGTFQTGVSKP
ncbi:P2Y purinoceptor 14-like isoform X1 [Entelurus aequoreus]|uniref:P2Y purinoceptor 14-like isoform X1 n=1 Tax=Entelurus aequoreus TaxID=161455 RepID=UPI002B1D7801|nr:P2Y purinoceptor 14-like isoform X1 [Entelurus aequoreus]